MAELVQKERTEISQVKEAPRARASGLEDAVAGDSSICFIDGPRSRLIYRGYSINDLANRSTFEEVAYLLYFKRLPNKAELKEFTQRLSSDSSCTQEYLDRMKNVPSGAHPMSVLRTFVSALSFFDSESENSSYEANLEKAVRLTARMTAIIASWARVRQGKDAIRPAKDLTHAGNFLYMLSGKMPDPLFSQALDLYFVLLADHELNASTFACRVTASTLSDYYSAITSAIGALKGPLHGGANEQVIKMFLEIGDPKNVEGYLRKAFENKKKIMGFGHRVYKVTDPRSALLKDMSRKVCEKTGNEKLFKISTAVEEIITHEKKLPSNVDFYSASLLYCIGIPVDLFTPMFAASRIAGWSAHFLEQVSDNRLIRPRANYTGALDLQYVPLEKR